MCWSGRVCCYATSGLHLNYSSFTVVSCKISGNPLWMIHVAWRVDYVLGEYHDQLDIPIENHAVLCTKTGGKPWMCRKSYFRGFHRYGGTPKTLDKNSSGKCRSKMDDDWGYPHDSGKLHLNLCHESILSRSTNAQYLSLWPSWHEFDSGNCFVQFREGWHWTQEWIIFGLPKTGIEAQRNSWHKHTQRRKKNPDGTEFGGKDPIKSPTRLILPLTTRHGLLGGYIELVNL